MDEFRDLAKVAAPLNPVTGQVFVEGRRVVRPPHPLTDGRAHLSTCTPSVRWAR